MPVTAITTFLPIVELQNRPTGIARSELENAHRLAHGVRALTEIGALLRRELHFDDLLESLPTELAGNAEKEARHAVLALEPGGAGQDALLVEHDRLGHLHGGGRGRVVRGSRLEELHDLRAAIARASDD